MTSFTMEKTTVTSTDGDLRAGIWVPDNSGPRPGIVLVDGSGESLYDDWGEWVDRYVGCGAVVMAHDKPGCGGSPGDWTTQSFEDRATDSLAALATLRAHPSVAGQPVGFLGVSQGGWISLLAAATDPSGPDFVITMSGPAVSPAAQEYYRIKTTLTAAGFAAVDVGEALAWITERTSRLRAGESPESVLAAQESYADRSWYAMTTEYLDSAEVLGFVARIQDFDPVPLLPRVQCPVFGAFGGADNLVQADESMQAYLQHLNWEFGNQHALAVFPGANHGLFTAAPDPAISRTSQLAPGYLPMVAGFLDRIRERYTSSTLSG
jgi:alpha-beta hydrolase superfamily lysophospholipase